MARAKLKKPALRDIRRIVRQIVDFIAPQKVILFGSCAAGCANADSDVDLFVVANTTEPTIHAAARIAAAIDHPFPIDIVVWRPEQFKASLARRGSFATQIDTCGKVLYEAGNS